MPYVLKEKQREFQRNWAAMKKRNNKMIAGVTSVTNSGGIVTWEQLKSRTNFSHVKTFEECVSQAKTKPIGNRNGRIEVAALALRACEIKHGGDRRTKEFILNDNRLTLKKFASDTSINVKTLYGWLNALFVIKSLPVGSQIDFTAARLVTERHRQGLGLDSHEDPRKLYEKMLDPKSKERVYFNIFRFSAGVRRALHKHGTAGWGPVRVKNIRKELTEALSLL